MPPSVAPWWRRRLPPPLFAWLLVVPVLAFFAIWNIVPLLWMIGLSFYRYILTFGVNPVYVGLQNFSQILQDYNVWAHIGLTVLFVIGAVGVETLLGVLLGFAFWGQTTLPGRRLALTLLFSPMVLAPVAVGTFFRLIYDPMYGILPYYIHQFFGVPAPNLLGNGSTAFLSVLATDVWMWTPFMILMTIAALGAVPRAMLEASAVDRLSIPRRLRYVIWPHAKFILVLGVLLRTIDAFKTFGLVSAMTAGGPGNATQLISLTLYREAFDSFSMGSASALALFALFIAIAFTSIYLFVLNYQKREVAAE